MRNLIHSLALSLSATAISWSGTTIAEQGSTASVIEEVMVTATRRETALQETAASITALTAKALTEMGAKGFIDYARFVPGVFFTDLGPSRKKYVIRGVQTEIGAGDSAPTVAQYLDEVPLTAFSVNQPDPNLYDVARVEVLRGPQGTLYGASSMGGTVRTVLNKPVLDKVQFGGEATLSSVEKGEEGYSFNAMLNFPIIDNTLGVRAVVSYEDIAGFVDNPRLNESDVNGGDRLTGRIMARWTPTESIEITALYLGQRADFDGVPRTDVASGELVQNTAILEPYSDDLDVYNVTANWDTRFGTFTFAASAFERDDTQPRIDQEFALAFGFIGPLAAGAFAEGDRSSDGEAYEFRFASDFDGMFNFVAGGFYNQSTETSTQNLFDVNGLTQALFPTAPAGSTTPVFEEIIEKDFEDTSLFGQATITFFEDWSFTAGLRWFDVEYVFTDTITEPPQFLGAPAVLPPDILTAGSKDTSLKFNLSWQATDDILFYFDAAEGFRRGGTNIASTFRAFVPESYQPDSLWSYQLGMNSQWLDGRVTLNAALYRIDWSDAQLKSLLSGDNGFGGTAFAFGVVNAGDVVIDGFELEFSAVMNEYFDFGASVSIMESELDSDASGLDPFRGLKGDDLPGNADFQAAAYFQFQKPFNAKLNWMLRADISHLGSRTTELRDFGLDANGNPDPTNPNPNYFEMDSYELINLRVGLVSDDWSAILFLNNVTDKRADQLFYTPFGQIGAGQQKTTVRPRTIGLTLKKAFY